MRCPVCKNTNLQCVRTVKEDTMTTRYRICLYCGQRIKTIETDSSIFGIPYVVKQSENAGSNRH